MISILNYVLLGILIYVVGIPVLEELATVIIQGLEVLKGSLVVWLNHFQEKADNIKSKQNNKKDSMTIGFTIPEEDEEEDIEDDE